METTEKSFPCSKELKLACRQPHLRIAGNLGNAFVWVSRNTLVSWPVWLGRSVESWVSNQPLRDWEKRSIRTLDSEVWPAFLIGCALYIDTQHCWNGYILYLSPITDPTGNSQESSPKMPHAWLLGGQLFSPDRTIPSWGSLMKPTRHFRLRKIGKLA